MPLVLGIDSSFRRNYVALSENGKCIGLLSGESGDTSENLVPLIFKLLTQTSKSFEAVDLIAVNRGPGSYTGLRCALATAEGLSCGGSTEVACVPTLLGICKSEFINSGFYAAFQAASPKDEFLSIYYISTQPDSKELTAIAVVESEVVALGEREIKIDEAISKFREAGEFGKDNSQVRVIDVVEVVENFDETVNNPALCAIAASELRSVENKDVYYCKRLDFEAGLESLVGQSSAFERSPLYIKPANALTLEQRRAAK